MSRKYTLSPDGVSIRNGSLQIRIPVVSLSAPPRQLNPSKGSSSLPSH